MQFESYRLLRIDLLNWSSKSTLILVRRWTWPQEEDLVDEICWKRGAEAVVGVRGRKKGTVLVAEVLSEGSIGWVQSNVGT